ncbi:MAG: trypsin-like peptidase domain-containing protein [Myxococcales bacterium]
MRGAFRCLRPFTLLACSLAGSALASEAPALPDFAGVARSSLPSVVAVGVEQAGQQDGPSLLPASAPLQSPRVRRGLGSGFVIRPDGYVLTNCHVVEGAKLIEVGVGAGAELHRYPARVVGCDEPTDLAVLKIEAKGLPALVFGDSDRLQIAQWVLAIGNPFGLNRSVSAGIVSQLGREDVSPQGRHGYFDFIQTDAPINPGSSGGPILDASGKVIGIANAVHSSGHGIAFAIPSNMARAVVPQLIATGSVVRSWMGVHVEAAPAEVAGLLGAHGGLIVDDVVAGGPAARAGLHIGDLVIALDGRTIDDPQHVRWLIATAGVGHDTRVDVERTGHPLSLRVRLARMPDPLPRRRVPSIPGLGAAVRPALEAGPFQETFGGEGARVERIDRGGPADKAGLQTGDVVERVNGREVNTPAALLAVTATLPRGAAMQLAVRRADAELVVVVRKGG